MQGFYDVTVIDDLGMGDAPFLEAIKNQDIDGLLARHPIAAKAACSNQIAQPVMQQIMAGIFGMPGIGTLGNGLSGIALSTRVTEMPYDEFSSTTYTDHALLASADAWAHSYTRYKRFWTDRSELTRIWTDPEREGYYYRDRFLWIPSHGVFSDIRFVYAYGSSNANAAPTGTNYNYWRASGTRLKDSGNPITLQKSASQGFLVEYTIKLFSR